MIPNGYEVNNHTPYAEFLAGFANLEHLDPNDPGFVRILITSTPKTRPQRQLGREGVTRAECRGNPHQIFRDH